MTQFLQLIERNRVFPTGNALLYISLLSVVFGRVRPIQGRTLFLFCAFTGFLRFRPLLPESESSAASERYHLL